MIDVQNINKTFHIPHDVKALVDVSTKIEPGEVVVVCGPSGSGKSTFLRCLNRLEKADTGHIYIDGIDVLDPKTNINKLRAEVGMVFQSFNLFPHKTVFHNITLAQKVVRKRSKEDAREKADFLLKKVGIHDKSSAYPDNLSGGQQQRLCIARTIADRLINRERNHEACLLPHPIKQYFLMNARQLIQFHIYWKYYLFLNHKQYFQK